MLRITLAFALLLSPSLTRAADWSGSVVVEPGGTLEIELDVGRIEVETHDLDEVSVDAYASGGWFGRTMEFELESDGADAELTGEGGGFFSGGRVRVRVRVPKRYSLDADTSGGSIQIEALEGEVRARTSGGKIVVDGARGDVEVETSGGEIEISSVRGDVEARTSGGPIRLSDVQGEIDVRTSGGSIRLHEVTGPIQARTSGGSIDVRFSARPEGELQTSGGGIHAQVPAGVGIDLEAETSGGRVTVEENLTLAGRIESQRVEAELNGGGPDLRLKTSGGNVRISTR